MIQASQFASTIGRTRKRVASLLAVSIGCAAVALLVAGPASAYNYFRGWQVSNETSYPLSGSPLQEFGQDCPSSKPVANFAGNRTAIDLRQIGDVQWRGPVECAKEPLGGCQGIKHDEQRKAD